MRKFARALSLIVAPVVLLTVVPVAAQDPGIAAIEAHPVVPDVAFPWEGPFGSFDQAQLQRGLQVFTEICSACHGLQYLTYRELGEPGGVGLPEDQVRAYAAEHEITDPETGDSTPALPSDHFGHSPDANAPDLSLIAKSLAGFSGPYGLGINQFYKGMGGPEMIVAILTGYTGEEKEEAGSTLYQNTAFPGGWIAMPPPLYDGAVEFDPEAADDMHSLAMDAAAFLTWAAEPKMMARKQAGLVAVGFLILLSVLLYFTNRRLWVPYKGHGGKSA